MLRKLQAHLHACGISFWKFIKTAVCIAWFPPLSTMNQATVYEAVHSFWLMCRYKHLLGHNINFPLLLNFVVKISYLCLHRYECTTWLCIPSINVVWVSCTLLLIVATWYRASAWLAERIYQMVMLNWSLQNQLTKMSAYVVTSDQIEISH